MRVISGSLRRRVLKTPSGNKIRPTSDQIKETLFNILDPYLYECVFADLFAGTGQIGIEALSRGASKCIFMDSSSESASLIRENISSTNLDDNSVFLRGKLPDAIGKIEKYKPDIIFMDPPYRDGLYEECLKALSAMDLSKDVLIVVESAKDESFDFLEGMGLYMFREKTYKSSKHCFIKRVNDD